MINLYDVPKPSMRAFQLLNMLSTTEASSSLLYIGASNSTPGLYSVCSLVSGVNATCIFANTAAVGKPDPPQVRGQRIAA